MTKKIKKQEAIQDVAMDRPTFFQWNEEMFLKYNNERLYFHRNPLIRFIENQRVKSVIKFLNPQRGDQILSIGCGEGYIENKIKEGSVIAIDISEEAVKRAKINLKNKTNIAIQNVDALNMPFEKKFFNKIACSEVIEHVLSPDKLVKEILRVSAPEALLVISIPNEDLIIVLKKIISKLRLFNFFFKNIPEKQEWHLHNFNLKNFTQLINNQLKIINLKAIPFSWLPIRYVIKCKNQN